MRFTLYVFAFFVTTLIFILLNWIILVDSMVFATFLISTFYFIFTKEAKVKDEETLESPKVVRYFAERNGTYVNIMAVTVGICGVIFWLLSSMVRLGLLSIGVWIIIIIGSFIAANMQSKSNFKEQLVIYLLYSLGRKYNIVTKYQTTISLIIKKEFDNKKFNASIENIIQKLAMFFKKFEVPEEEVRISVTNYVESLNEPEVTSDEIRELENIK